jgi:hypothetical protein
MRCQWPALPREQVLGSIQRLGENSDQAVQTRREQLGALRAEFGFRTFCSGT